MSRKKHGWFGESERHRLARLGLTKAKRLKSIRKVIDKDLSDNIDTMEKAAGAAGRDDLQSVYDQLRENQSEEQLIYEEKIVPAKGMLARYRRKKARKQSHEDSKGGD